ncbi:hypothetical protein K461DRAFT_318225 [Myriangium duriaei CBS 260.36]|uniref:Xylanolytic transcriptional activator regulatory domain-containing protein n=1 Tax=Myriangium duriaei CBS 260.36 TaxID=1168546 RepID=A0A9P4JAF1_9PEZI|nr:hypothetical protein K461DRAFT_318225 [Myriangium duriaei CBS 260.36]
MTSTAISTNTTHFGVSNSIPSVPFYLVDYELHHSPLATQPSDLLPRTVPTDRPDGWPSNRRRIPPHRPIQRNLDWAERPAGSHWGETVFIMVMLGGVAINARASACWQHVDPALHVNNIDPSDLPSDLGPLLAQECQNSGVSNGQIQAHTDHIQNNIAMAQKGSIMSPPPSLVRQDPCREQVLSSAMDNNDMLMLDRDLPTSQSPMRPSPGSSMDVPWPLDVFDFGMDNLFGVTDRLDDVFTVFGDQEQIQPFEPGEWPSNRSGFVTPNGGRTFNLGMIAQAFRESIWMWTPASADHAGDEQSNLTLLEDNVTLERRGFIDLPPLQEHISQMTRGKMLAMVLKTCEPMIYPRVLGSFPSPNLLSNVIHNFLAFHVSQEVTWIHPATIELNRELPEFLTILAASGATISHVPEVLKLGFAMQEAVRVALEKLFELDNSQTRELRPLQVLALSLDIALWSGVRRKMEIAESFAMPLITMMRRAGHFRRSLDPGPSPAAEDTGFALEQKWRRWAERESRIRLALYLFSRDMRSSMSLLSPPLLSYAELGTDLPCSKALWLAKNAVEWKAIYLNQQSSEDGTRVPDIRACMHDATPIFAHESRCDPDLALYTVISAAWGLIWQYREMKVFDKSQRESALALSARHQEATKRLEHLKLTACEWKGELTPIARLLHEQCMMHLFVSLEDVQLLAGKEGEAESRRIHPALVEWADTTEARQAILHAGQMIRAASDARDLASDGASAVAIYHASIVFWAYAVLSKPKRAVSTARTEPPPGFVKLDGEPGPDTKRFLMLGKGIPCIGHRISDNMNAESAQIVPLNEPAVMMTNIITLLRSKCSPREGSVSPLLENLISLMQALGKAATNRKLGL